MMNQQGKYFLVTKHVLHGKQGKEKKYQRTFFEEGEFPKIREVAKTYSQQHNREDFLIVKVVEEISSSAS
jgi:hypothetical protein